MIIRKVDTRLRKSFFKAIQGKDYCDYYGIDAYDQMRFIVGNLYKADLVLVTYPEQCLLSPAT